MFDFSSYSAKSNALNGLAWWRWEAPMGGVATEEFFVK